MSRTVLIGLGLWFAFMFASVSGIQKQSQANSGGVYDAVPQANRSSLQEAVGKMVDLQKQGRWAEIYDLVSDSQKGSREDFVRESSKRLRLASFEPTEVVISPTDQNEWLVVGCGVFAKRGGLQSGMYARLVESKWSVSTVLIVGPERGHTKRCGVSPASHPR